MSSGFEWKLSKPGHPGEDRGSRSGKWPPMAPPYPPTMFPGQVSYSEGQDTAADFMGMAIKGIYDLVSVLCPQAQGGLVFSSD